MTQHQYHIMLNYFSSVNTLAAELLYSKVRDWCGITDDDTTVLGKNSINIGGHFSRYFHMVPFRKCIRM